MTPFLIVSTCIFPIILSAEAPDKHCEESAVFIVIQSESPVINPAALKLSTDSCLTVFVSAEILAFMLIIRLVCALEHYTPSSAANHTETKSLTCQTQVHLGYLIFYILARSSL